MPTHGPSSLDQTQTNAPAGVIVRDAGLGDMAAVAGIYAHYVRTSAATFEVEPPPPEEMASRFEDLKARNLPYLVAEQDGKIIGYAYGGLYRTRWGYRYTIEDSVYIDPTSVGRGVGRLLLSELIERATAIGYRQMIAVIGDSANAASIALHSQLGFRVIGALPSTGRKFDRWIDSVLMQRALGDGNTTRPTT